MTWHVPKFLSGLWEITDAWLIHPKISGTLMPVGDAHMGSSLRPFQSVRAGSLYNSNGLLSVNSVTASAPLLPSHTLGVANMSLNYDPNTLQLVSGQLSVKTSIQNSSEVNISYTAPLSMVLSNATTGNVALNYATSDFQVEEGQLKIKEGFTKGIGAIKSFRGVSELIEEGIEFLSDFVPGDYADNVVLISVKTSGDFQQTGNTLAVKSKGGGRIPFYDSVSGFDSSPNLTWNSAGALMSPRYKLTNINYSLSNEDVPSVSYLAQFIQSQDQSGIDVQDRAGSESRRNLFVRRDEVTIGVNSANKLFCKMTYDLPLKKTETASSSALSLEVDGTSIKVTEGKLAFSLTGAGIFIDRQTSSIKCDIDETLKYLGNKVSLNLVATNPISLTSGNQIGLKINPDTMQVMGDGALSAKQILVDNQTVGWTSDLKLKGLYSAGAGIKLTDFNKFSANFVDTEYPLVVNSSGHLKIYYDNTLITDGAGNLSCVPILVDNYTIIRRQDATFSDGALKVNLFGENGVSVVGNKIRGSYTAGSRITISGSSISANVQDLADDIASNASDLVTTAATIGTAVAAASAGAVAAGVAAASALTLGGANSGLIAGLTTALGVTDGVVTVLGLQSAANTASIAAASAAATAGIASASAILEAQIIANALASTTAIAGLTTGLTLATTAATTALTNIGILDGLVSGIIGVQGTILAVQASHTASIGTLVADAITQGSLLSGAISTGIANSSAIVGLTTNVGILDTSVGLNTAAITANTGAISSLVGVVSGLSASTAVSIAGLHASIAGTDLVVAGLSLGAIGTSISLASLGSRCSILEGDLADTDFTLDQVNHALQDLMGTMGSYMKRDVDQLISSTDGRPRMMFVNGSSTYFYTGSFFFQSEQNQASLLEIRDDRNKFLRDIYIGPSNEQVATRPWVSAQGYVTSSALSVALTPYALTSALSGYMPLQPEAITSSNGKTRMFFEAMSNYFYLGDNYFQNSVNSVTLMRVHDAGVDINVPLKVQGNLIASQNFVNNGFLPVSKAVVSSAIQYTADGSLILRPNTGTSSTALHLYSDISGYYRALLYGTSAGEYAFKLVGSAPTWSVLAPSGRLIANAGLLVQNDFRALTSTIESDSIHINKFGTGDRMSALNFHNYGAPEQEYTATIRKEAGYTGHWRFLNEGNGSVHFDSPGSPMFSWLLDSAGFLENCHQGAFRFCQSVVHEGPVAIIGVKDFDISPAWDPTWYAGPNSGVLPEDGSYAFSLMCVGAIVSNAGFLTLSDRKAKKDIRRFPENKVCDLMQKVQPALFKYKKSGAQCMGFISQEVREHFPTVVHETDGQLFMDHTQLISVLWKAVTELSLRVKELEKSMGK